MRRAGFGAALLLSVLPSEMRGAAPAHSLAPPAVGERSVRLLTPTVLEITVVTPGAPTAPPEKGPAPEIPAPALAANDFTVKVGERVVTVQETGFRRRPVYAPLKQRDLRIGNAVYLRLAQPVAPNETVSVAYNGSRVSWLASLRASVAAEPGRENPAIHVNQVGYLPEGPKVAIVGYYLGTLGEMPVTELPGWGAAPSDAPPEFELVEAASGKVVHRGRLTPRPDRGMPHRWYQKVWAADFSAFRTPGEYRVAVPGMGASYPFFIDAGIAGAFARTYALGIYHQRCGAENALPFTRFVHAACHTAPAEVPPGSVRQLKGFDETPRDADLFPYVRRGKVDVAGGHHDAGDYSKYTVNSAGFIHHLMFAADAFGGVAALDNLGVPESGDGIGDVLQLAKWEADFLIKLQDRDGGFYFLVYPRDRKYEQDVLPDKGDPQIVWPKNTAATAAAVAALAQCASSAEFKRHFPTDATRYLAAARKGWEFLLNAQLKHPNGSYRKFTHYGDDFKDEDELAWAAVELFLATRDPEFAAEIKARLDPASPDTRRWGWRRLTEGYGRAIRSYAFAERTGRVERTLLDARLLRRCEDELIACADDWSNASRDSAYGTSYPEPTKRVTGGGWYFALDNAFDLVAAAQLDFPEKADRRPAYRQAIHANLAWEAGTNPVNVSFVTGLGWKRPTDIVHQYAQNDRRVLPPGGIPIGSIQEGFYYMDNYRTELGAQCFPLDGAKTAPYPILDRWGDSFNLQTEFVIVNQARALGVTAWLLAQTPTGKQAWKPAAGRIAVPGASPAANQPVVLRFESPAGLNLEDARIVWEARDHAPVISREFTFTPKAAGTHWVEAEAQWPDGRRAVAVTSVTVP